MFSASVKCLFFLAAPAALCGALTQHLSSGSSHATIVSISRGSCGLIVRSSGSGGSGQQQNVAAVGPDGFKPPAPINTGRSGLGAARPLAIVVGEGQWPGGAVPDTPMSPSETPRSRTARQTTQVGYTAAPTARPSVTLIHFDPSARMVKHVCQAHYGTQKTCMTCAYLLAC